MMGSAWIQVGPFPSVSSGFAGVWGGDGSLRKGEGATFFQSCRAHVAGNRWAAKGPEEQEGTGLPLKLLLLGGL